MDFMSWDFDLAENVFYFHNAESQSLAFVLDWDTKDKFYSKLLSVSIVIWFISTGYNVVFNSYNILKKKRLNFDESKFGRRKYHRGHHVEGQWVFGGVERETGRCFLVPVEKRDKDTLLTIIKDWILPGTLIISDCWKFNVFRGYSHLTVNHSIEFKNPESAHTNNIEGMWCHTNASITQYSRKKHFYAGYLAKYMFLKRYRSLGPNPLVEFFKLAAQMSYANILKVPNDHSMVLAKPGETSYFHTKIPAFDIKYIEDCFKIKDFPDPTKYLIKSTSPASYTKNDIYDCWLYQNKSWSDLVSISDNKNNNPTIISSSTNVISQAERSNDDCDDIMMFNDQKIKKNTRMPYSHKEEINIVKYIVKNNYAFNVTGVTMWQKMERDKVCKYRTWQSMKERYLKRIKFDLNSGNYRFPFLSPKDLKLLRLGLNIEKISKEEKDAIKSRFLEQRMVNSESDSS
ncbi:Myb DNA-bind 2 domain-containing protein [Aphis craccivora]|uniref:Myb DNA-bind 2 domain-containing protein n=1 Tax=Aphis craccivora TaxID=307492 RepID=A0A6G0YZ75_APHCR|nr:Myb DNA-bind 2 domain-containing protein [Aphis craccivora]